MGNYVGYSSTAVTETKLETSSVTTSETPTTTTTSETPTTTTSETPTREIKESEVPTLTPSLSSLTQATETLENRLKSFPAPLNNLGTFLQNHRAILSGSFLFAGLIKEIKFDPNDIDIFFTDQSSAAIDELVQLGWKYKGDSDNRRFVGYVGRAGAFNQFKMVHPDSMLPINCIQYKLKKNETLQQQIDANFDLDGCTLQWNGLEWHIAPDVNYQDFFERKLLTYRSNKLKDHLAMTPQQFQAKYGSFALTDGSKAECKLAICQSILMRLKKYETRGFTITNAATVRELVCDQLCTDD